MFYLFYTGTVGEFVILVLVALPDVLGAGSVLPAVNATKSFGNIDNFIWPNTIDYTIIQMSEIGYKYSIHTMDRSAMLMYSQSELGDTTPHWVTVLEIRDLFGWTGTSNVKLRSI
jgi:hypothetical protein